MNFGISVSQLPSKAIYIYMYAFGRHFIWTVQFYMFMHVQFAGNLSQDLSAGNSYNTINNIHSLWIFLFYFLM